MNKIKITQVRSIIGRDETQKRTIQALGLGKINRSRIHNDTPAIRGMANKVRHLVMVEEIKPEKSVPKATEKPKKKKTPEKVTEQEKTEVTSTPETPVEEVKTEKPRRKKKSEEEHEETLKEE